jgi:hypothetical protein
MSFNNEDFTIQAWLKFGAIPQGRTYAAFGYGDGAGYTLTLSDTRRPQLIFMGLGVGAPDATIPDDNAWHHLAVVHVQGQEVRYYLDGALKGTVPHTAGVKPADNRKLVLGSFLNTVHAFVGQLDRLKIGRGALSAEALDSKAKPSVPPSGALFDFNEGEGNTVMSRTGLEGRFIGTPSFSTDTPSGLSGDYSLSLEQDLTSGIAQTRVEVLDPAGTLSFNNEDFTIQVWAKFGQYPENRGATVFGYGDGAGYNLMIGGDRTLGIFFMGLGGSGSGVVIPNDGNWHHLAVVHVQGQELRYYIDGNLVSTKPYTLGVKPADNRKLTLGSFVNTVNSYSGLIDRLWINKGVLSANALDSSRVPQAGPVAGPAIAIGHAAVIAWPTIPAGYILQSADEPQAPVWMNVTKVPIAEAGLYKLFVPATETNKAYRLIKP